MVHPPRGGNRSLATAPSPVGGNRHDIWGGDFRPGGGGYISLLSVGDRLSFFSGMEVPRRKQCTKVDQPWAEQALMASRSSPMDSSRCTEQSRMKTTAENCTIEFACTNAEKLRDCFFALMPVFAQAARRQEGQPPSLAVTWRVSLFHFSMLVVVPPVHTNILLATATQCCLFWCDFQPRLMLLLLAWLLCTSGPLVNICSPQLLVLLLVGMISFM